MKVRSGGCRVGKGSIAVGLYESGMSVEGWCGDRSSCFGETVQENSDREGCEDRMELIEHSAFFRKEFGNVPTGSQAYS